MIEIALQQDGSTVSTVSTFAKQMVSSIWIDSGYGSTREAWRRVTENGRGHK
jgi:hypothetical protein